MKIKCVYRCIVNGDIVKPDKVLDVAAELAKNEPYKSSFVALDASPAHAGAGDDDLVQGNAAVTNEMLVAGLTRDQAIAKLRAAKVNVPGNISNQKLIDRYNETFSTDAE
jgi:hypothetical protein